MTVMGSIHTGRYVVFFISSFWYQDEALKNLALRGERSILRLELSVVYLNIKKKHEKHLEFLNCLDLQLNNTCSNNNSTKSAKILSFNSVNVL